MPIYTWTSQEGTFSADQKKALAKAVTEVHCRLTGAPRRFVRVIFLSYPHGNGFVDDVPSATILLLCQIRAGRSMDTKQSIMTQINDAAVKLGGISSDALAIVLQEIPPNQGMEFGTILPIPTPREAEEWLGADAL
jgi:phenylpyruvate tautomerase PptA (4-oxalocrotonate tautomerase family)